jgi:prepilin peptidase CpaA
MDQTPPVPVIRIRTPDACADVHIGQVLEFQIDHTSGTSELKAMLMDALRLLLFPTLMAFAASSDLLTMTISNRVSLALIAGFFVLAFAIGMNVVDVAAHVGAGLLILTLAFGCFVRGWIGGGDAKLAASTALWLGFDQIFNYLLCASLLGGLLTVLIIRLRVVPLPSVLAGQEWVVRLHRVDAGVPYGIALAAAALIVYPDTIWMKAFG